MIVVLMGVAGVGKTTVGKYLAETLEWSFYEGDKFQPPQNIEKMRRGDPLTDEDRAPWLTNVRTHILDCITKGQPAVIACSALRRIYREQLRVTPAVRFIYLKADYNVLRHRLEQRTDHFMKTNMLQSQFSVLEEPKEAITIDATLPIEKIVERIRHALAI